MYGGSNIGGAIKYVTKRPSTDLFEGRMKLLAGEQGIVDGEISLNIPLDDNWAMRVFAYSRKDGGFMTNPNSLPPVFGLVSNNTRGITQYEENAVRLSISGGLTDTFSMCATARFSDYDGPANNWSREVIDGAANSNTGRVPRGMMHSKILDANNLLVHERDTVGASLEMIWAFNRFDLTSITFCSDTDSERLTDVDGTQLWVIYTDHSETYEVFTQEFRFTSISDGDLQ